MRNSLVIRSGAMVLAMGSFWFGMSQQPGLSVEKIADDLHVIVGNGGNVAVLTTDEGVILVDDKFEKDVPEILAKVKAITTKPVRYIINTHHHGDHTGGNQKMFEAIPGLEIVQHQNARAKMVEGRMPGIPRVTFGNETAIHLGGKEVRAYYFGRGHTNGDITVFFPAHRVMHLGDMYNTGGPFIDVKGGGSGLDWTKTIYNALKLEADTVIPGHGAIGKKSDLAAWNGKFETMRNRLRVLKQQGKSKEEAIGAIQVDDLGWGVPGLKQRSLPVLFDEL
jgi:cyclase